MELPKELPHQSPSIFRAHTICLRVEEHIQRQLATTTSTSQRAGVEKALINIRILGHLLSVGPTDEARSTVAVAIICCDSKIQSQDNFSKLIALGDFYDKHFIRLSRKNKKGRTPAPSHLSSFSSSPRVLSFDTKQALIETLLVESPQNHSETQELINSAIHTGLASGYTECCHIIPASINTDLQDPAKKAYASAVWTILDSFGYKGIMDALAESKIHSLKNVMTLDAQIHVFFNKLSLWLEPTDTANPYTVHLRDARFFRLVPRLSRSVTFTSTSPNLALPSAVYLKIRAACCRVAHMSGTAEYLERMGRDTDDYNGFAPVVADDCAGKLSARLYDLSISSSSLYEPAS